MPYNKEYIKSLSERPDMWKYLNQSDKNAWGQLVTYNAFKDSAGREPTDAEMNQFSGQAAQAPDQVRQQIMSLPQQQQAQQSLQGDVQKGQQQQQGVFQGGQQNMTDLLNQAIQRQQGFTKDAMGQQQGLGQDYMSKVQDMYGKGLGQQRGMNQDYMSQLQGIDSTQNDLLGKRMQSQRDQLMSQLTTGPEGEAFREKYNNMGLLNSGAFNTGLANKFGNLAAEQQQDILGQGIHQQDQLAGAAGQGYGNLSGLMQQGQGAQFGAAGRQYGDMSGLLGQGSQNLAALSGQGFGGQAGLNEQGTGVQSQLVRQGLGYQTYPGEQALKLPTQLQDRTFDQMDFNTKRQLMESLSQSGQPSDLQKAFGMAGSAGQAMGGIGTAMGPAATVTSYVCLAMINVGLLCEMDLDDFHLHVMPAMFKKGRAFWHYARWGKDLVRYANAGGINWRDYKPLLFDRVMAEKDPVKAVDLYADGCRRICMKYQPSLWDELIMRVGILDSLPFIPRLIRYKPFRDAFSKCLRIKMLIIYDKPRCGVHYGA